MIIGMKKTVNVDVKTVTVFAKVRDEGTYTLKDAQGDVVVSTDGCYVPGFLPGSDGDYLELIIDLATGLVLNWDTPTRDQIERFIEDNS
jgi:hypothetical protein